MKGQPKPSQLLGARAHGWEGEAGHPTAAAAEERGRGGVGEGSGVPELLPRWLHLCVSVSPCVRLANYKERLGHWHLRGTFSEVIGWHSHAALLFQFPVPFAKTGKQTNDGNLNAPSMIGSKIHLK